MRKASLIIPSHRGADRLPVLFDALLQQNYDDWEAIVVIDGEVDDSEAVVARYAESIPVRAIVLPQNQGRVGALNTGFEAATGDVLIRCDDDFEPGPGHIAAHVAAHAEQPCGAIGLPVNIAPGNAYMRAYGAHADAAGRRESYSMAPDERWRIWGGNTSVSREVYERVGGFDDRYRGYGWEDLDFGYRVHLAGYPIEVLPDAEVRHHLASITTAVRAERAYRSGIARQTFESIHGQGTSGPRPSRRGWWNRIVAAIASGLTLDRTRHLAQSVDFCLPFVPAILGRKLAALLVESAARAGFSGKESHVV